MSKQGKNLRDLVPATVFGSAVAAALCVPAHASAQVAERPAESDAVAKGEDSAAEIRVVGDRRSIARNVVPLASLDESAIAATGATNMSELLRALRPVAQSADGSDPIMLLNGQRMSGYQEIGTLPPEAIEKVEVLPEPAALKFGYPPTRRVMNFITKRRFQQVEVRGTVGTTTRQGSAMQALNLGVTRLSGNGRATFTLERKHTGSLLQSEREILPDPDILFDEIGNVSGINGGELDPSLSNVAGQTVTVAPVPTSPADRGALSGYIGQANRPRLFDPGRLRTLSPLNDSTKAEAAWGNSISSRVSASLSLSAERIRDRSFGPATASLFVPAGSLYSPFDNPVLVHRYLTEAGPLNQRLTTTKLHAGGMLRGIVAGWRWDVTAAVDQQNIRGFNQQNIDLSTANAAIAAGITNPFAPLDPSSLADRLTDRTLLLTRTVGTKAVITNTPLHLPAGLVTVTATVEAERSSADSRSRGTTPFDLHLSRMRTEGGLALDVPLASRREDVLPWVGELSLNGSGRVRRVGGFGSLHDSTLGLSWTPITGIQFLVQNKRSDAAPPLDKLSSPLTSYDDVPFFDQRVGRTVLVTAIGGGNPDLAAERRRARSIALNIKPLPKRELRLSLSYEIAKIYDQSGTVGPLSAQIEALFPDRFVRDAAGGLLSVSSQPVNYFRQDQHSLSLTLASSGPFGKPPPALKGGKRAPRAFYYAGLGPTYRFKDRLQLRQNTPAFDLLRGESVTGWGVSRFSAYGYGGINYLGNGANFDFWYGGRSRVRSDNPEGDLRFDGIFKFNLRAFISVHHFLRKQDWTRKLQLMVEVTDLTDSSQRIRDRSGRTPNRYQRDYLNPVGRTVRVSLRKAIR
jgi:hypothetical protein